MTYIGRFETVKLLLSFPTIDTTITFLSKTAIEWAAPNVKATECKEWETLENMIDEAGRAKCLDLLSSHSQSFSSSPSTFQGETKVEPTEDNKKTTDANKSKKKQKPNDRCACGSMKKYKKCCGSKKKKKSMYVSSICNENEKLARST